MAELNEHYDVVIGGAMMGRPSPGGRRENPDSMAPSSSSNATVLRAQPRRRRPTASTAVLQRGQHPDQPVHGGVHLSFPSWFDGSDVPEPPPTTSATSSRRPDGLSTSSRTNNCRRPAHDSDPDRDELAAAFFYNLDDIVCVRQPGRRGVLRRRHDVRHLPHPRQRNGVTYHRPLSPTSTIETDGSSASPSTCASISCGTVVNAAAHDSTVARYGRPRPPVELRSASPTSSQPNHSTSYPSPSTRRACTCAATAMRPAASSTSITPSSRTT